MRYRALDQNGDYTFGSSARNFFINTPAGVAQAVLTRLLLIEGEYWLDLTEGTPYKTQILGRGTIALYDLAIRTRILETQGVTEIVAYSSLLNPVTRHVAVAATIDTLYGQAAFNAVF